MAVEEPGRVGESAAPPPSAGLALWILVALAVVGPWPFGSTPPWAVRGVTLIALTTATAVSFEQARRGGLYLPRGPLWPVAILVSLGVAQLMPLPASVHELLAPGSAAVWHPRDPAASAVMTGRAHPISIAPAATTSWLGLTAGLVALALLAVPALGRRRTLIRVAWILVGAGTLVAAYGIVARAVYGPLLYGRFAVPTVSPLGPFVNKNHFAGYVLMPALLALGLGRGLWRQAAADPEKPRTSPRALVAFAAAAIMILAVLSSLSRGAALGILFATAVFAVVEILTARRPGSIGRVLAPASLGVLLVIVVTLLPSDAKERLALTRWQGDRSTSFRFEMWRDSLRAWMASPVAGQGLGAFADVLPRFKSTAGAFRVEHPENEALEVAVEGGLVALSASAMIVVGIVVLSVRAIRSHRDRVLRGVVSGAVSGMAGLTAHGLVDFNLRIPANATMFVAVAALAVAARGSDSWRGRRRWSLLAALSVVVVLYARSGDPGPILQEARAFAVKAQADDRSAALRAAMADRRVRDYLGRRPADPEGWLIAAWCALKNGDAEAAAALSRYAVTLDPQQAAVREAAKALTGREPGP